MNELTNPEKPIICNKGDPVIIHQRVTMLYFKPTHNRHICHNTMKTSEEVAATFHIYFIPALDVGGWPAFQQGQNPRIYQTEGLAGPTTCVGRLQTEVSLPQLELNPPALSTSNAGKFMVISLD